MIHDLTKIVAKAFSTACLALALGLVTFFASAKTEGAIFGGVEFPGGAISFADAVVSFSPPSSGSGRPVNTVLDPAQALGPPNYGGGFIGYVSLGDGGSIVLRFLDNLLTGSGSSALDLWIFEIGPDVEDTFVEISKNGVDYFSVGKVFGATSGIDIDAFGFGVADQFSFVRLIDDTNEGDQTGQTVGADIDSVGAISTVASSAVPEPATLAIWGGIGLVGLVTSWRRQRRQAV